MLTPMGPAYHVGDRVYVRLSINERQGEGLATIAEIHARDSRGWFYSLDTPIDVEGVLIERVYEDELERARMPEPNH